MRKFLKTLNGFLATLSLTTMVFMPVAQGKEAAKNAEKVSQAQLEQAIQTLGLNKSMTYGEFYQKNKDLYPTHMKKMVEALVAKFKDEPMPQFEVATTQNSKGEQIATLRVSNNNQLSNIQFLGEKGKFVKFDNTNLTEEDLINFDDMVAKLYYGDATHRKGMGDAVTSPKTLKTKKTAKAGFKGYPKITKESWKKMTPLDRARFMINLRMLYSSAQEVLDLKAAQKGKGKKTSSLDSSLKGGTTSSLQKWNQFFAFLNQDAFASNAKCVVAGYIGSYSSSKSCQYPAGVSEMSGCQYPCNPTIYGYADGGRTFCLPNRTELQTATHYNQGCDKNMPMSSVEMTLPAKAGAKDSSRYQDVLEENKKQALADPKSLDLTKKYLDSMLSGTPEMRDAFQKGNLTPELLAKLQEIQNNFNTTISAARNDCAADAKAEVQYDKNFWGACDQLHKRFLFVGAYLDKTHGCTTGETAVDPETLTCACPNSSPVVPGAKCGSGSLVAGEDGLDDGVTDSGDEAGVTCDPTCSETKKCVLDSEDADGVKVGKCVARDGSEGGKDKDKPGFWGKVWGGIKKALPWVGAGIALWAIYKIFTPKKPKLNAAADRCPNGTIPPCGQTCTPPKALQSNGSCACPACPPGQSLTNANSCLCEATTTQTTIYVCADGVTQVTNLANCPEDATYTCWDNSVVTNPINCPEQPATKPSGTSQ